MTPDLSADIKDPEFIANPYDFYQKLHAVGGVAHWRELGMPIVGDWENVNALLRDRRFGRQILHLATREELGWPIPLGDTPNFDRVEALSLLALEGEPHKRLRTLVNRAFVSRQVERLRPAISSLAEGLVNRIEANGKADLVAEFAAPLPVVIICDMLGVPTEMGKTVLDWSHKMVRMFTPNPSPGLRAEADQAAQEFALYVNRLAAEKRVKPGDDLISHMLTTHYRGERISEAELVSTAILLLNAGHEATVHQTGNAILSVLQGDPNVRAQTASQTGVRQLVEEALRFRPPVHYFTRYALQDVELGDLSLKKGDQIALMLAAANRDPKRFVEPDRFDPDRNDQSNISFGAGVHFCIGAPLARIELAVALETLFNRLPRMQLSGAPKYTDAYPFHGLTRLDVSW